MADERGITCLLTVHGIGFQVAPDADDPDPAKRVLYGYADPLHARLSRRLGWPFLSDDPHRAEHRARHGEAGAIYVHSHWPVESYDVERGLARLGTWRTARRDGEGAIDASGEHARLVEPGGRVAHVALVYAHPQNRPLQHLGSLADTAVRALLSQLRYGSPPEIGRLLFRGVRTLVGQRPLPCPDPGGLRVRGRPEEQGPPGVWGVARALEEDVSTYVARNDVREEVRGFVRQALLRLAAREDVAAIVVNAHSQGTTVAFDAARSLPPLAARKVRHLVTAGSPLRKYATLFYWGTDVGSLGLVDGWTNFWDPADPVADPLGPADWDPGGERVEPGGATLFQGFDPDTGQVRPYAVADHRVDNVARSCGDGLRAHNYWDNDEQVVAPLAALVTEAAVGPREAAPTQAEASSLLAP